MTVDGGLTKTWSSTQATIAQSSGEAEYYATVRAAGEGLGMKALMEDLGWEARIRVWVDSSAAKAIASRIGLGKIRHLEVKFLWLQQMVKDGKVEVRKVRGDKNPADLLTKPKPIWEVSEKAEGIRIRVKGRTGPGERKRECADEVQVMCVRGVGSYKDVCDERHRREHVRERWEDMHDDEDDWEEVMRRWRWKSDG